MTYHRIIYGVPWTITIAPGSVRFERHDGYVNSWEFSGRIPARAVLRAIACALVNARAGFCFTSAGNWPGRPRTIPARRCWRAYS